MSEVTVTLTRGEVAALVAHLRKTRPRMQPKRFGDFAVFPTLATADLLVAIDKLENAER